MMPQSWKKNGRTHVALIRGAKYTKSQAKEEARAIAKRTPLGKPLEGGDRAFVCDLLRLHPNAQARGFSEGVAGPLTFDLNGNGVCLWHEGRDVSLEKCYSSRASVVKKVCRALVQSQIDAFQDANPLPPGTKREDYHVDHENPQFDAIVASFFKEWKLNIDAVETCDKRFADASLNNAFADHHQRTAQLRWLTREANQSRKRKRTSSR
jgi:hypothetical protein